MGRSSSGVCIGADPRALRSQDSKPGEVDLHGLFVKEAIAYTDQSIQEARARGDTQLHLIVGARSLSASATYYLRGLLTRIPDA